MAKHSSTRRPARPSVAWTTAGLLHTGLWLTAPALAVVLIVLEAALTITIIATALYAPDPISARAFRMLPWTTPPPAQQPLAPQRTPRPDK
ncbi:hypothetical protein [Actinomadura napierensis]|uniref:Uncharacterized protein n=1 Tax=Actinomadura napierensis TaxID=267854 RepID=A0ABN2ZVX9_9ACTN